VNSRSTKDASRTPATAASSTLLFCAAMLTPSDENRCAGRLLLSSCDRNQAAMRAHERAERFMHNVSVIAVHPVVEERS
jgi:hypothetical protein